jgi:hypothetical protein
MNVSEEAIEGIGGKDSRAASHVVHQIDRLDPNEVRMGEAEPEARSLGRRGHVAGNQCRPEIMQHVDHIGTSRAEQGLGTGHRRLEIGLVTESFGCWLWPAPHRLLGGQCNQRLDMCYPVMPAVDTMGGIVGLALVANLGCFFLLPQYRSDNLHMRSMWLCSRNDLLANVGVLVAALCSALLMSSWPDMIIGALIASVFLRSTWHVVQHSRHAMRQPLPTFTMPLHVHGRSPEPLLPL